MSQIVVTIMAQTAELKVRAGFRPRLGRHHARQPVASLVRLDGLRPALRAAPHRPPPHPIRGGHLRHAAPRAAQDRRPGPPVGPAHQARHGLGAPLPRRVRLSPRQAHGCRASRRVRHRKLAYIPANAAPAAARNGASSTNQISTPAPASSPLAAAYPLRCTQSQRAREKVGTVQAAAARGGITRLFATSTTRVV